MDNEPGFEWYDPILLTLVGLLIVVAFLAIYPGWPPIATAFASPNAPAWVQAIGSVGAIFVAVLVPFRQARHERERLRRIEFDRRIRNTQMAISAVRYVSYVARGLKRRFKECQLDTDLRPSTHEVTMLRSFCERFPVVSLENADITARFFGIQEGVVSLEAKFLQSTSGIEHHLEQLIDLCDRFTKEFNTPLQQIWSTVGLPENPRY